MTDFRVNATTYEPLYSAFLFYFNVERDYFECHEVMEALWMEEGRDPLCQGLLQVAVGLYHHRNGNTGGAVKLLSQAMDKLKRCRDVRIGIDFGKLMRDASDYLADLQQIGEEKPFHDLDIVITDPLLADEIERLKASPPAKGDEEH